MKKFKRWTIMLVRPGTIFSAGLALLGISGCIASSITNNGSLIVLGEISLVLLLTSAIIQLAITVTNGFRNRQWRWPLKAEPAFYAGVTIFCTGIAFLFVPRHPAAFFNFTVIAGVMLLIGGLIRIAPVVWKALGGSARAQSQLIVGTISISILLIFPPLLTALGTNGNSYYVTNRIPHGWLFLVEVVLLAVPPLLLYLLPDEFLRKYMPWRHASRRARSLIPMWLAITSAASSTLYFVLLHFGGGSLSHTSLGEIGVIALGATVILIPIYRTIAKAAWSPGMDKILNPKLWLQSSARVGTEIRAAINRAKLTSGENEGKTITTAPRREPCSTGTSEDADVRSIAPGEQSRAPG
jgi:hypothetical protein